LVDRAGIGNLRIIQHDAVEVLDAMIAPASLAGVHIFFPDPWPKKRHHKRRLVQPPLVERIASRLAPGGYLHLATDVEDYAEQMRDVVSASGCFAELAAAEFAAHPARPTTKFESRGVRLGHSIHDLVFRRVGVASV
ncbi:MAG: tRNA (guanosine(46)-N7)-methyltransferase TrmB, partial [Rhodocyclaceae bacterium]|nr:tRNA (guanosine(46)-N7)-methyltransferase TrmB [Rhodocyclaceae bacterium]